MFLIVMSFWNSKGAIINTIFKIAGYTYGPILGLYLTGLFSKIKIQGKMGSRCLCCSSILYLAS